MQGDVGLIPAWEAKNPHALWSKNQNKTWKHNIVTKSIQTWKMVHILKKNNKGGRVSFEPRLTHPKLFFSSESCVLALVSKNTAAVISCLRILSCPLCSPLAVSFPVLGRGCCTVSFYSLSQESWLLAIITPTWWWRDLPPRFIPKLVRKCLVRKRESGEVLRFA